MIERKVTPKRGYPGLESAEPYYPTLFVSSDDLPEVKDWEVGESYCIEVKVTMTGKNDYKGAINGTFDIKKFCLADAEGDDLEDDEEDEPIARKSRSPRA